MFTPYRTILSLPGSTAFTLVGLLARMPISMVGLGLVLLISATTGSYGVAGTVTAAYVLTSAVLSPYQARFVDRYGQHRILPIAVGLNTAALSALVVAVRFDATTPVPHLLAAVAGAAAPQIGSYVRARWSHLLAGRSELQTAYALEALFDEVIFIAGPVTVTFLATSVRPEAGVVSAILFGLIGGLWLSAQRRTEPPVQRTAGGRATLPLGWTTLGPLVLSCVALGALFGAVEVVVVAFATEEGHRVVSGLLLASWATGSMLAAAVVGALRLRSSPVSRYRVAATAMALTMVPLPFIPGLVPLAGVLFLAGFAISPTLVASVGVVQATVPAARLTEGITWTTSGLTAGVAAGAAAAGQVVDAAGARDGFFVPLASGALAAIVSFAVRVRRPRLHARTGPTEEDDPAAAEQLRDETTAPNSGAVPGIAPDGQRH